MAEGPISWGATRNNCRVGISYESIPVPAPGATSITVTAYVYFFAGVNMFDHTNSSVWSGWASGSGGSQSLVGPTNAVKIRTISNTVAINPTPRTVSLSYTHQNIEYTGNLSVTASVTLPGRTLAAPDPPTGVTPHRLSDNRIDVLWTRTNPDSPGKPYQHQLVQRQINDGGWATLAQVAPTHEGYSDQSPVANRKYRYRVLAINTGGEGRSAESSPFHTTPAAPTSVAAVKSGGNITVSWSNNAVQFDAIHVQESQNGGAFADVTTVSTSSATSWVHVSPNPSVSHRYRIRARINSTGYTLFSAFAESNTVQLLAPPNAPVDLAPNGMPVDQGSALTVTWKHNPVDTTAQSQYEIGRRTSLDNGVSWTSWVSQGVQTSGTQSGTIAAVNLESGSLLQWRVRTRGEHIDWSPWSVAQVAPSSRPAATITNPGASVVAGQTFVDWTFFDADGTPQSSARVVLYDAAGAVELETWSISGTGTSQLVTGLQDGTSYQVGVTVRSGGLDSVEARQSFAVAYARPPAPVLSLQFNPENAALVIGVLNPAGSPLAVYNELYCDGVLISTIAPDSSYVHPIPDLRGGQYWAVAYSALPSSQTSDVIDWAPEVWPPVGVHFNHGDGFATHCALMRSASITEQLPADVVRQRYAGDSRPVPTFGSGEEFSADISGLVLPESDPGARRVDWEQLRKTRSLVCFRSRSHHRFGVVTSVGVATEAAHWANVSVSFEETET